MFQPTLPAHTAELMHASEFERNAARQATDTDAGLTRLSGLSNTLLQDLQRHDPTLGPGLDLLQVLAAALRHGRALQLYLELDYRVIPLTVWPLARTVTGPLTLTQLLDLRLPDLRILRVEGQQGPELHEQPAAPREPLGLLLWELALRGPRNSLLPEISGLAAYRVSPGAELQGLKLSGSLADAVQRLKGPVCGLREIAGWPGFDEDRAVRLLNGLYLQSALMVSRSHPAALGG